jgi:Uma2 family endonuclease
MSNMLRKPMTLEEFLAWEERQEPRYEFDGRPVATTGGTIEHALIGGRLRTLLINALHDGPCKVFGPTMKIEAAGHIRYPDAFVTCTPLQPKSSAVQEPVVVFEVLSPGTPRTDRIGKPRECRATQSVQRYIILEQDSIGATVFTRSDDVWTVQAQMAGDALDMSEIGVSLALTDIYADVDVPATLATTAQPDHQPQGRRT